MGSSLSCCSDEKVEEGISSPIDGPWRIFSYKELNVATNGFSEEHKLGEGGFGSVYWGKTTDGLQIAVKKLKSMNSKAEMEFAVEVEVLGRVRHKNLLGLRGYCADADQRLIVYDYMPNLSLLSHLHGQFATDVQLDWKKRMKIAIGSAEGLVYLHHEVSPHIIHRDVKASNVLLDSNFEPLVADFGFAKLIPDGVSHMTTRVKGTLGYLAPEYAMWGKVSESCDVYSFGILLLEIFTGRKPIEKLPGGVKRTITEWVEPLITKGKFKDIIDPKLRGNFDENQLKQCINVAALCVQSEPENRPTMKEVAEMLKGYHGKGGGIATTKMRLNSVKYKEELMVLDDQTSDEDGGYDESRSAYGVFGAMEVQRMQDPYRRTYGDRRS
ncbi:Concanavalin A-like lectin/glucanase domain, Serine/threonine-protein kinase, SIK1/2 [Heracleum sosnowskyi]|uniref:Concanavalin A-like lectin/glucanase domain, Serine/threonine-protein kinase, SIK1/2 n=1 Tax=Heracleum sosnowskyi TaxID=360622 RepID=A0AAD8N8F3_9APIA|nr:Concanavalin A-like lectin/glucanase domain, Serine/threonine-protein kinase, SIK1/2 [Heracleum sosnowskyi]